MQTDNCSPAGPQPLDPLEFVERIGPKFARRERFYQKAIDRILDTLGEVAAAAEVLGNRLDLRKGFFQRFKNKTGSNKKSHRLVEALITYTMDLKGPRAQAYARVIEIARSEGIKPSDLPQWVKDAGGIEAVRRNSKPGASPADKAAIREQCEQALSSAPSLATLANLHEQRHRAEGNEHNFAVALVCHDPLANTGDVLWGCADDALVRQFLQKVSKDVLAAHPASATAQDGTSALSEADAAIEAALAALGVGSDETVAA